jgi:POT family proton-dependent oligopeptide transporter
VACVILGPIIQYLYSFLAKRKIAFGPIARITAAFLFCAAGMAYSAGIQRLIYSTGPCYDRPLSCANATDAMEPNDVNVWVQLPTYFILAIAEIFGFVTASEYAYSKAPQDAKTIVQALTQLTAAMASALGMALSPVSRNPKILIMYACLAAAMAISAAVFWLVFRSYDKIDRQMDEMKLEKKSDTIIKAEEKHN